MFDPKELKVLYGTILGTIKKLELSERRGLLERILGTYCQCGQKLIKGQCFVCDVYVEK